MYLSNVIFSKCSPDEVEFLFPFFVCVSTILEKMKNLETLCWKPQRKSLNVKLPEYIEREQFLFHDYFELKYDVSHVTLYLALK